MQQYHVEPSLCLAGKMFLENTAVLFYPLCNQVVRENHQALNIPITSALPVARWLLGNLLQSDVESFWPITAFMGRAEESC